MMVRSRRIVRCQSDRPRQHCLRPERKEFEHVVSANIMPKNRRWKIETASLEELRLSFDGSSTGYAGRYEIDTSARKVTHLPLVTLDPADAGKRLIRNYRVDGDKLLLPGGFTYEGRDLVFTVHRIRARK